MIYFLIYLLIGICYIQFTRTEEDNISVDIISIILWPLILVLSYIWK